MGVTARGSGLLVTTLTRLPGTPDLLCLLAVPGVDCYGVAG